jgi:hypothetical protein
MPSPNAAAQKIPITVSSFSLRVWLMRTIARAVAMPATAPDRARLMCRTKPIATPGKTAWATASPMKAMPRKTTNAPTATHTTADMTATAKARCMNRCDQGSVSHSIIWSPSRPGAP